MNRQPEKCRSIFRNCRYAAGMLICLLVAFAACAKKNPASGGQKNELHGKVFLDGASTHSGITVALYAPAPRDSAWDAARAQYPFIGMEQTQALIFDHRERQPLLQTTTGASGEFTLSGFDPGVYNLVISKAGYGWRYFTDLDLQSGSNALSGFFSGAAKLFAEEILPAQITGLKTLEAYHHYLIQENALIPVGSRLEINSGVWIRFNAGVRLDVEGHFESLTTEDTPATLTIADKVPAQLQFLYVRLKAGASGKVANLRITHSEGGLKIFSNELQMSRVYAEACGTGVFFSATSQTYFNAVVRNCDNGIRLEGGTNGVFQHWLILRCKIRGIDSVTNTATIRSNYFSICGSAIDFGAQSRCVVERNVVQQSGLAFNIYRHEVWPSIQSNTVDQCNEGIRVINYNSGYFPAISDNNFTRIADWLVYTQGIQMDIGAQNNYWGVTDGSEIRRKIWDGYDYTLVNHYTGKVIFEPFLQDRYPGAVPN